MTQDQLAAGAGMLLSLCCAYWPGLSERFDALPKRGKAIVMTLLLIVVSTVTFVLSCMRWVNVGVVCDAPGLIGLIQLFMLTLVTNQSTFFLFVRPYRESV